MVTPASPLRQDEIASVHVAVTSARPWSDYEDSLQPKFELTAAQAYDKVSRATQQVDSRTYDGMGFALKAAVPAPTDPAVLASNTKVMDGKASAVQSALATLTNAIPVEANLQYLAATALYQEVQLINRAFRDAIEFEGQECYVVRLQVSVIPKKRDAPYDVTSDLSFFLGKVATAYDATNGPLKVIPMLATDSIESALSSSSEERLRSLSLAITALLPQAGIGAAFDRLRDAINAKAGRDYNSTFTIARVTDNTVRCRFGAVAQTTSKFSLLPQNHFVTLLVFVPRCPTDARRTLRVIANNSLISTKSGKKVDQSPSTDFLEQFASYLNDNHIKIAEGCCPSCMPSKRQTMGRLLQAVAYNDFTDFLATKKAFTQNGFEYPSADILWADVTSILSGSQYGLAEFQLPLPPKSNEDKLAGWATMFGKKALAVDDGEATIFELRGFPRMRRNPVFAVLTTDKPDEVAWAQHLVAGPGTYDEVSQTMTFRFPSLASRQPIGITNGRLRLQIAAWEVPTKGVKTPECKDHDGQSKCIEFNYLAIKKAKVVPPPAFKLVSSTKFIVTDEQGKGKAIFAILRSKGTNPDPKVPIEVKGTIEGATITAATADGSGVTRKSITWTVTNLVQEAEVSLELAGLHPDQPVIIGGEGAADPITFKVALLKK